MSIHLSKRTIDKLPTTDNPKGQIYLDDETRGFGVIVYPSGRKVFVFQYGKNPRRRVRIGDYGPNTAEDARKRAGKLRDMVNEGKDPLDERRAKEEQRRAEAGRRRTFKEWAETYLAEVKEYRKSFKDYKYHLGRAVERFGKKNLADITPRMVEEEFHRLTREHSEVVANRWAATLQGCFKAAKKRGLIDSNPVVGLDRNKEREGRTRTLSDAEFAALGRAIEEHPEPYERAAFLMLTKTGARLSEVLHARWEDFDFDSLLWTMPETKAGRKQTIPIHESLAAVLQSLPREGVFVVRGKNAFKPRYDLKNAWAAVLKASGIKRATLHDLRRTFCVRIARTAGLQIASKLLRHSDIRTTARHYAPVEAEQMREALERNEAAVLQFKKKAKKAANQ